MNKLTKKEAIAIREINSEPMMSSLRIAEVTGKRHKDVLESIANIFSEIEEDGRTFALDYLGENNKTYTHYLLPEREFNVIISGYSAKYRMQLIDELMAYRKDIKVKAIEIENSQQAFFNKIKPKDTYGDLVEKTGLAKTKLIRSSYRSDRHDKLSKLIGERKRCENRLGGFFDDEIQVQIDALNVEILKSQEQIKIESKVRKIEDKKLKVKKPKE